MDDALKNKYMKEKPSIPDIMILTELVAVQTIDPYPIY